MSTRHQSDVAKMVKVCVEVREGSARFRVGVQAGSIRKALGAVGARYPREEVRVIFPIELEGCFVEGLAAGAGTVEIEPPREVAA